MDGLLLARHAGDRAGAGARGPRVRGRRDEVLRALPVHRRRPQRRRHRIGRRCGIRRTSSSTTCSISTTGEFIPLKVRSLVGLIPLLAVETIEPELLEALPDFKRRMDWFLHNRPDLAALVPSWEERGVGERRLLALVRGHRMKSLLARMLDPDEFLSDHGIRSLSAIHRERPFSAGARRPGAQGRLRPGRVADRRIRRQLQLARAGLVADQLPAHRGAPEVRPLLRRRLHRVPADRRRPAGLDRRGRRRPRPPARNAVPARRRRDGGRSAGRTPRVSRKAPCDDQLLLFHEYFDGDTGRGLGASHQTGWTALVAKLLDQRARRRRGVSGAGTVATAGGGVLDRSP